MVAELYKLDNSESEEDREGDDEDEEDDERLSTKEIKLSDKEYADDESLFVDGFIVLFETMEFIRAGGV